MNISSVQHAKLISNRSLLLCVAFVDYLGLGVIFAILAPLLLDIHSHLLLETASHMQRLALFGVIVAVYPVGQFLGATIFGKLSDHHGRKKVLSITLVGTLLGLLLTAVAISINSFDLLLAGRLITGLFAGNVAVTQSSMADISSIEHKKHNFSLLQISIGLGWILGPFVGGVFASSSFYHGFNYSTPLWIVSVLTLFLIVLFVTNFTETLTDTPKPHVAFTTHFSEIFQVFKLANIRSLFLVWIFFMIGHTFFIQFFPTYLVEKFHFTATSIGYTAAYMGILYVIFQFFIAKKINAHFSSSLIAGFSIFLQSIAVSYLLIPNSVLMFYCLLALQPFCQSLTFPNILALFSNSVEKNQQGQIMGMIFSIQALVTALIAFVGGFITHYYAGMPLLVGGASIFIAWLLFIRYMVRHHNVIIKNLFFCRPAIISEND